MTKIDLITGFLGSGKTTFIRNYVEYLLKQGQRVCILENDFGAVNVDTMLVSDLICDNLDVEMVAGGCDADCHRRRFKTKLIAMGMKKYDRVIVEPSGLYDVDEFFDTLYDEPLDSWYEIGSVVTLVDAKSEIPFEGAVLNCFKQEISNSGVIILSKTELTDIDSVNKLKEYINETVSDLNRTAILEKPLTDFSEFDYEMIANAGYKRNDYIKFDVESSGFSSLYYMDLNYGLDDWKKIISLLFSDDSFGKVFRVKGFCPYKDGYYEVNATSNDFTIKTRSDGQNVFIVIGETLNEREINKIIYQ